MSVRVVERTSVVRAPAERVWDRVVSPEGINHEMMPWLSMSMPRGTENLTIDTLEIGAPLGRAWIRLFGLLPVDYDDLSIVALVPGRSFHEKSSMFSAKHWEHERTVTPVDQGTQVHDRLTFTPRLRLTAALHAWVIARFFAHRHRRLVAHFG